MTKKINSSNDSNLNWHQADIVAALHKVGWSMRQLSLAHGYKSAGTLSNAMARPYPKAEKIIADAIGVDPSIIWPSRYAKKVDPKKVNCNAI